MDPTSQVQWLTSVIPANQEVEIGKLLQKHEILSEK
jgi:hypothetical protein